MSPRECDPSLDRYHLRGYSPWARSLAAAEGWGNGFFAVGPSIGYPHSVQVDASIGGRQIAFISNGAEAPAQSAAGDRRRHRDASDENTHN